MLTSNKNSTMQDIVKHVDTAQTPKKNDISHRTLRYFVEIVDNNYEITFFETGKSS